MAPRMGPMKWQEDLDEVAAAEAVKRAAEPELIGPVSSAYTSEHENGRLLPVGIRKPLPGSSSTPRDPALWPQNEPDAPAAKSAAVDLDPEMSAARDSDLNRRLGSDVEKIGRIWSGGEAMVRPADAVARLMAAREKARTFGLKEAELEQAKTTSAQRIAQYEAEKARQAVIDKENRDRDLRDFNALEASRKEGHRIAEIAATRADGKVTYEREQDAQKKLEGLAYGWEKLPDSHADNSQLKDHSKLVTSENKMQGLIQQMRAALAKYGGGSLIDRAKKYVKGTQAHAALTQIATQLGIEGKNVAELGALSGPDMELMLAINKDPTSIFNVNVDMEEALDGLAKWGANSVQAKSDAIGVRKKAGATPTLSDEDKAALAWANANAKDPRAAEILKRLGK